MKFLKPKIKPKIQIRPKTKTTKSPMKFLTGLLIGLFVFLALGNINYTDFRYTSDYFIRVANGEVPGSRLFTINGTNAAVPINDFDTVWPESNRYTFPASAQSMTFSSDDANDTAAGTGCQAITVLYLDGSFVEKEVTKATNGQSGVTLASDMFRINDVMCTAAGSNGFNLGIGFIGAGTITAGKPANVFAAMQIGENHGHNGFHTVPAGMNAFPISATFTGETNKTIKYAVFIRKPGGTFISTVVFHVTSASIVFGRWVPPFKVVEKSDIEIRAFGIGGAADTECFVTFLDKDIVPVIAGLTGTLAGDMIFKFFNLFKSLLTPT